MLDAPLLLSVALVDDSNGGFLGLIVLDFFVRSVVYNLGGFTEVLVFNSC